MSGYVRHGGCSCWTKSLTPTNSFNCLNEHQLTTAVYQVLEI